MKEVSPNYLEPKYCNRMLFRMVPTILLLMMMPHRPGNKNLIYYFVPFIVANKLLLTFYYLPFRFTYVSGSNTESQAVETSLTQVQTPQGHYFVMMNPQDVIPTSRTIAPRFLFTSFWFLLLFYNLSLMLLFFYFADQSKHGL